MSSPGTYSRCWANSMLAPKNRLLCIPVMNPSTTCLARRSSRPMRAMVAGCRNRLGSSSGMVASLVGWAESCRSGRVFEARHLPTRRASKTRPDLQESRREYLLEPLVALQIPFLLGGFVQEALDDSVGGDPLGRGGEVGQDAVPQHR